MDVNIGVIGYGYWGPNLVRNFAEAEGAGVAWCSDTQSDRRSLAQRRHPGVNVVDDARRILEDKSVDAVVIATPVSTHYRLAEQALSLGKHVLITKPMAQSSAECERLMELAAKNDLVLMVDHTYVYTGAVRRMKELLTTSELGDLHYFDSVRVNLGLFQHDVDVLWDLAPHDLSILTHLVPATPREVSATGSDHVGSGFVDVAYVTLYYDNSFLAHLHLNWLSPVKIRRILVGGSRRMLVYDDMEPSEKVRVYDRGIQVTSREGMYKTLVDYRTGDMWAPKLEFKEALAVEAAHFVECVRFKKMPLSGGAAGLTVVRLLEAASQSLATGGATRGGVGGTMEPELSHIAADVRLGEGVQIHRFVNLYGCDIGSGTRIGAFVEIQRNATVGRNCKISSHTFICEGVTIEDECFIGHHVVFVNDRYPAAVDAQGGPLGPDGWRLERTRVCRRASIGSGAVILCGVTIGEASLVGAGSVVTRDVAPRSVVAGNPARPLRDGPGPGESPAP